MTQFPPDVYALIDAAVAEDQTFNDPTSQVLIPAQIIGVGMLRAKASGVLAGMDVAGAVFHRVDQDRTPACVESCAVDGGGALAFGDLSDAESTVSKTVRSQPHRGLRPDLELNTGVRYRGV